jgi:hypothetical protein
MNYKRFGMRVDAGEEVQCIREREWKMNEMSYRRCEMIVDI